MDKKAQSQLEIVVLICLAVLAFVALRAYLITAVQGRWKTHIDQGVSDEQYERAASSDAKPNNIRIDPSSKLTLNYGDGSGSRVLRYDELSGKQRLIDLNR